MGPEALLPCSQELATDPYPEPVESTPHLPTLFPKTDSNIIFSSVPRSSEWSLPSRFSGQNILYTFLPDLPCACYKQGQSPNIITVIKSRYITWAGM
jgi:hypothetical protein